MLLALVLIAVGSPPDDAAKSAGQQPDARRGRFEAGAFVAAGLDTESPATMLGGVGRAAFHPLEFLALSARFTLMATLPGQGVLTDQRGLNTRVFVFGPTWSVMGDLEWTPLRGQVSSNLRLEGSLLGGGGVVSRVTSASAGALKPAFDLGVAARLVVRNFVSINLALINTTWVDVDAPAGTMKQAVTIGSLMFANAGVSLFFP